MINPLVFYIIDLLDSVETLCALIGGMSAIAALVLGGLILGDQFWEEENEAKARKLVKPLSIVAVVCFALVIAIPSKQTMTEMLVAKYATSENVKNLVDYIVETWERLK